MTGNKQTSGLVILLIALISNPLKPIRLVEVSVFNEHTIPFIKKRVGHAHPL